MNEGMTTIGGSFSRTYTREEVDCQIAKAVAELKAENEKLKDILGEFAAAGDETNEDAYQNYLKWIEKFHALKQELEDLKAKLSELEGIDQACDAANKHVLKLQVEQVERDKRLRELAIKWRDMKWGPFADQLESALSADAQGEWEFKQP